MRRRDFLIFWRPLVLAIVIAIALTIWLRFDSQVHSRTHIQGICTILSCKIFAIKEDKASRLTESAQLFEPCRLMLFMNRETTMSSTTNLECQQNQTISMWCAHIPLLPLSRNFCPLPRRKEIFRSQDAVLALCSSAFFGPRRLCRSRFLSLIIS